jgi:hypothetical protein
MDVSFVYAHKPPTRSLRSKQVVAKPYSRNVFRAESPHAPVARRLQLAHDEKVEARPTSADYGDCFRAHITRVCRSQVEDAGCASG